MFLQIMFVSCVAPPLGQVNIDPGFRTGCKVVVLDKNGNCCIMKQLSSSARKQSKEALNKIDYLVEAYKIELLQLGIALQDETEAFIKRIRFNRL